MLDPPLVRRIIESMKAEVTIPITVKCRIGVDSSHSILLFWVDCDSYESLVHFISVVSGVSPSSDSSAEEATEPTDASAASAAPLVSHFIVHARKCWLNGVNTRENRRIPDLRPDWVFRLLDDFPTLDFTLNGGIKSFAEAQRYLDELSWEMKMFLI